MIYTGTATRNILTSRQGSKVTLHRSFKDDVVFVYKSPEEAKEAEIHVLRQIQTAECDGTPAADREGIALAQLFRSYPQSHYYVRYGR